jgi:hypothetical protein
MKGAEATQATNYRKRGLYVHVPHRQGCSAKADTVEVSKRLEAKEHIKNCGLHVEAAQTVETDALMQPKIEVDDIICAADIEPVARRRSICAVQTLHRVTGLATRPPATVVPHAYAKLCEKLPCIVAVAPRRIRHRHGDRIADEQDVRTVSCQCRRVVTAISRRLGLVKDTRRVVVVAAILVPNNRACTAVGGPAGQCATVWPTALPTFFWAAGATG